MQRIISVLILVALLMSPAAVPVAQAQEEPSPLSEQLSGTVVAWGANTNGQSTVPA